MLGTRFARIVEECLHRLDRGENLPDILADNPVDAEQLKPLLMVAMASRSLAVPQPSQTAQRLGRNQMLAEMDQADCGLVSGENPFQTRFQRWVGRMINNLRALGLTRPAPSYRLAMFALVILFGSGWIVVSAAASGPPGDMISAFASDFQNVLAFFNQPSDGYKDLYGENYYQSLDMYDGDNSPFAVDLSAKVALLLDIDGDQGLGYSAAYANAGSETHRWGTPAEDYEKDRDEEKDARKAAKEAELEAKKAEKEAELEEKKADIEAAQDLKKEELEEKKAEIAEKKLEKKLEKKDKKDKKVK